MVSRNQWNNAKRVWFLVSQTVENPDGRSGRYQYRAPLQAFRRLALAPKIAARLLTKKGQLDLAEMEVGNAVGTHRGRRSDCTASPAKAGARNRRQKIIGNVFGP
jgi:hypothetical protein